MTPPRASVLVSVLLFSCAGSAPSRAPVPPPALAGKVAASAPAGSTLAGSITVDPAPGLPTKGKLVVGWLTSDEAKAWNDGRVDGTTLVHLFERFRVAGDVDVAGANVPYRFEAPSDAAPFIIVDVDHSFWRTFSGRRGGWMGVGKPGGGDVVVRANQKAQSSEEPCAGERMELLTVDAPDVAGAVGNPTKRRFCVYLPPSYSKAPARRYPVVFLFGGFMSSEMTRFRDKPSAGVVADDFARESGREAILVGVDASTNTGSTYLEDSPVTGKWETFMAERALSAIDARFRTLKSSAGRGMVGQSTGGHIAVSFVMRHPDLFGAIGATAPDALDIETWLFDAEKRATPWVLSLARLENDLGGVGQMISYSADWSPNPGGPWAWPYDLVTGQPRPEILAKWNAHAPARWLDDEAMTARIREKLSGRILLAISEHDEFGLTEPALAFSRKLRARGIDHELEVTPEGHMQGGQMRTTKAIRFVIAHLAKATP